MSTYILGESVSQLRRKGEEGLFRCGACGDTSFTIEHVHNPYGHDACQRNARCAQCGTTWAGGYYTWEIVDEPTRVQTGDRNGD